ncbi:MAG: hypothetical protein ACYDEV_14340, partial [Acidiferrobacter sp.]
MPRLSSLFSLHRQRRGTADGYQAVRLRTRTVGSLFGAFGIALIGMGAWHAYDTYQTIRHDQQLRATALVSRTAERLALTLNEHFADLRFLAQSLIVSQAKPGSLSGPVKVALRQFLATHRDVSNVNILGPRGNHIWWSARLRLTRPIAPQSTFHPLIDNPHMEIGGAFFAHRFQTMVVPLRYRVDKPRGGIRLYIGDPLVLNRLTGLIPNSTLNIRLTTLDGHPIAQWLRGKLQPVDTTLKRPMGTAHAIVGGYPWAVHAQWTNATIQRIWWQRIRHQLPLFILLFCGSQYAAFLVVKLLSREMQLRMWHETLYQLNKAILNDIPLQQLFHEAAARIQANLLAPLVVIGLRHEYAAVGPGDALFTESLRAVAFTITEGSDWTPLPAPISPRPMVLALGDTGAVIVIFPPLGLRTIPWSNLVQEIAGLLTSAINQKRQKLDIDRLQRHQVAV